jgi:hypothetical protein
LIVQPGTIEEFFANGSIASLFNLPPIGFNIDTSVDANNNQIFQYDTSGASPVHTTQHNTTQHNTTQLTNSHER